MNCFGSDTREGGLGKYAEGGTNERGCIGEAKCPLFASRRRKLTVNLRAGTRRILVIRGVLADF